MRSGSIPEIARRCLDATHPMAARRTASYPQIWGLFVSVWHCILPDPLASTSAVHPPSDCGRLMHPPRCHSGHPKKMADSVCQPVAGMRLPARTGGRPGWVRNAQGASRDSIVSVGTRCDAHRWSLRSRGSLIDTRPASDDGTRRALALGHQRRQEPDRPRCCWPCDWRRPHLRRPDRQHHHER